MSPSPRLKGRNRDISIAITELLLAAIAIALSILVINYVIPSLHVLISSTHKLIIYPDSTLYIDETNKVIYADIKLYSDIKPSIEINYLIINNIKNTKIVILSVERGDAYISEEGHLVMKAGTTAIVRFYFPSSLIDSLDISYYGVVEGYLLTHSGSLYKVPLKVIRK
jgi:hypothetical protein